MEEPNFEISNVEADVEWFIVHHQEITRSREGKYIAIKDRKIIAEADNFGELLEILKRSKIDSSSVFIDSVAPRSFACIL
jgi:hypothetical protein